MPIFSCLRPVIRLTPKLTNNAVAIRSMSDHRVFPLAPSRWQWRKFKDLLHYYLFLGIIPCSLAVLYANVFIGPATLTEIPEGCEPEYWEYYRSPVTRFIARYFLHNPQQDYEKYLHHIFVEDEKRRLRALEKEIKTKMGERNDYQAYYYKPVAAKYHRITREAAESIKELRGD